MKILKCLHIPEHWDKLPFLQITILLFYLQFIVNYCNLLFNLHSLCFNELKLKICVDYIKYEWWSEYKIVEAFIFFYFYSTIWKFERNEKGKGRMKKVFCCVWISASLHDIAFLPFLLCLLFSDIDWRLIRNKANCGAQYV